MTAATGAQGVDAQAPRLADLCRPGLIVHLLFPNARRQHGLTEHLVDFAVHGGFYRAVEIAEVENREERRAIRALTQQHRTALVYWLSFAQMEDANSISSPDEECRRRGVATLLRHLPFAAECGAHAVGIVSGRDVDERERPRAFASLKQSILELAHEARRHGLNRLEMETMDREAHKKHILGPTEEAIAFIRDIRGQVPDFHLVFDTAHIKLLGEEPLDTIAQAAEVTGHIHLANCVADPGQPLFGDNHMPLGEPGFLTTECMQGFLQQAARCGVLGPARPIVSVEVGADGGERAWELEEQSRRVLREVLA